MDTLKNYLCPKCSHKNDSSLSARAPASAFKGLVFFLVVSNYVENLLYSLWIQKYSNEEEVSINSDY